MTFDYQQMLIKKWKEIDREKVGCLRYSDLNFSQGWILANLSLEAEFILYVFEIFFYYSSHFELESTSMLHFAFISQSAEKNAQKNQ